MHVISFAKIRDFFEQRPDTEQVLRAWYKLSKDGEFANFAELKATFNSVDKVGKLFVFNVGGNNFRIIAAIHFNRQKLYIRHVLTHSEYDKGHWKEH